MLEIKNETALEEKVRKILSENLDKNQYVILENKKIVDIMILDIINNKIKFIETKYEQKNHLRLGIGSENGKGFQPEILYNEYKYFEENLRWILGTESDDKYRFATNKIIREYASGGKIEKKYNSISKKLFEEIPSLDEKQLVLNVKKWLEEV